MKIYKYNINELSDESYEYYRMHMSKSRRDRLDRLKLSDDRRRSLCGYMLAVKALSELSGIAEDGIAVNYSENGKPFSENTKLHFSISHSGDYAVCAVSERDVGIDIEKIRQLNMQAAKKFASETELIYIFGHLPEKSDFESADEKTLERFFEVWTKKEAYGKLIGEGIGYAMRSTDIKNAVTTVRDGYVITVCEAEK